MKDIDFMQMALDLALKARGQTSPNPLVGAVIVKGNRIISKGYHRRCGSDHAEVVALTKAGRRARGAKLYVTLEPCSHYGRTPPCVHKIIDSGIKEVVVGMKDPNPVNNGTSIRILKCAGVKVKVGFLENELRKANEAFVKYITQKMPFVVVKSAQTLDGKIAAANGQSKWITSSGTRRFARYLRNDFDAMMVGVNTVLKDDPRLNPAPPSKKIKKIILDGTLRVKYGMNLFKDTAPANILIATTRRANKNKLNFLSNKGINVMICPDIKGKINLPWLLKRLAAFEITSVLIEGGAEVVGSAIKEKVADKALIFIAPKLIGDQTAKGSVIGMNIKNVNQAIRLKDLSFWRIGEDILVEGYIKY